MNLEIVSLPFIGAFIGYFTNYVAIKMLFLPKKPYFIFGFRVPFTPGLIPKKRKELVEKISTVVSDKIVNRRDIVKYIYKKKNRAFLYEFSQNLVDGLLSKRISTLNLNYGNMEIKIKEFLDEHLEAMVRAKFKNINIDIDYFVYNAFLLLNKEKKLIEYVSKEQLLTIKKTIQSLSNRALDNLAESMNSPEIKQLVREKIKESMDRYADGSNILVASFISMASPLIEDNDKIVDIIIQEIISILTDNVTRKKVEDNIYFSVWHEIFDRDLEHVLNKTGFGSFDEIRKSVSRKAYKLFEELNIKEKIIDGTIRSFDTKALALEIVDILKQGAEKYTFFDAISVIKPDIVTKLPSMAVNNLLYVLRRESEMIFNFDIGQIAKNKLEKLDISDIEDVVLNISKDQFKYINIFGGILGFIIGLIEVLLNTTGIP